MNSSQAKNSWRLVLSGVLCVLICDIHRATGAVFKSPNSDDANFWRNHAEAYLKRVLQYDTHRHGIGAAKNVIIFVGDGMGVSTLSTGRILKGQMAGRSGEEESLSFDHFPYTGFSKTYNTDRQVPDSAGTATALFTGIKTKSGVIGVDYTVTETNELAASVTSIMDWAQAAGKRTGIVTTTRVTHATPAAAYAHSFSRNWECNAKIPDSMQNKTKDIARQLVENAPGNKLNVILGGGRSELGVSVGDDTVTEQKINGSMDKPCNRTDGRNLVNTWLEDKNGSSAAFVWNTSQLLNAEVDELDYLLGLFADEHMSYETLRDKTGGGQPSLSDMTEKAIRVLKRKHSNGFVLMVEGGRIDHGHHQNIPRLALAELVELDRAVERALGMVNLEDTLIIVTADHSHAMTFNGYPDRGNDILGLGNRPDKLPYETITYANGPGFRYHRASDDPAEPKSHGTWIPVETMDRSPISYRHLSSLPLDDETHGGEDVAVFAAGPGSGLVRGTFEQNYIAYVMSYAGCMGPARRMNEDCSHRWSSSGAVASNVSVGTVAQLLISLAFVVVAKMFYNF
ncbi:alkaline phosphatase 4-like [Topomyia yanbarensis]|uniref:alkaline phosphatase 4-like n=1 Tax=Topomyia yanbarensis TaxID=2498891 RepID=UPI00273BDA8D|nr:alkaline phosphatase 4-like [Topomyia yanbarensis]